VKRIKLIGSSRYALVDDGDYQGLSIHLWRLEPRVNGDFYARALIGGKSVRLHRFILKLRAGSPRVDHKDHDGLNNQRQNLRLARAWQNGANKKKRTRFSSRYKGVHRHGNPPGWEAVIRVRREAKYLGVFRREDQAAAAYDAAARIFFGKFASFNLR
jgi:hypothetical protein